MKEKKVKSKESKVVLVSGGFDPLHSGHLAMINDASKYGDVIVALNSDDWLIRKKGFFFMDAIERCEILTNISSVKDVVMFDDSDDTAIDALKIVSPDIFANGGDRTKDTTPESDYCKSRGIEMIYGVGGFDKKNSSSKLVRRSVQRKWGKYEHLYDGHNRVKTLMFESGKRLREQKHEKRDEIWVLESGSVDVTINGVTHTMKEKGETIVVKAGEWHTAISGTGCTVIEIQVGNPIESDIEYRS